jgi:hypothetical protein
MKKILTIISICFIFSTSLLAQVKAESIGDVLDIDFGPEVYEIQTMQIDDYTFKNSKVQANYKRYKARIELLKKTIINKYENEEFSYYQMRDITTELKSFVYHVDRMFRYARYQEMDQTDKEVQEFFKKSYQKSRIAYNNIKNLIFQN